MKNKHTKKKRLKNLRRDAVSVIVGAMIGMAIGSIVGLSEVPHLGRLVDPQPQVVLSPINATLRTFVQRIEDRRQQRLQHHYKEIRRALGIKELPKTVVHLSPLLTVISDGFTSGHREPTESHTAAPESPENTTDFPAFDHASWPVGKTPNWGKMRTPEEWNRTYGEMEPDDFVSLPRYDLAVLTTPMKALLQNRGSNILEITAKLFYSTRHFSAYDLDAGEYTGAHPGVDLKLAPYTPVGSIGGGRVHDVRSDERLGNHVIIEHRIGSEAFYSIYAHLDSTSVSRGEAVTPGQVIGRVGLTGNTNGYHVHLQVDRGSPNEAKHIPYAPKELPSISESERHTVNPIKFMQEHRS